MTGARGGVNNLSGMRESLERAAKNGGSHNKKNGSTILLNNYNNIGGKKNLKKQQMYKKNILLTRGGVMLKRFESDDQQSSSNCGSSNNYRIDQIDEDEFETEQRLNELQAQEQVFKDQLQKKGGDSSFSLEANRAPKQKGPGLNSKL